MAGPAPSGSSAMTPARSTADGQSSPGAWPVDVIDVLRTGLSGLDGNDERERRDGEPDREAELDWKASQPTLRSNTPGSGPSASDEVSLYTDEDDAYTDDRYGREGVNPWHEFGCGGIPLNARRHCLSSSRCAGGAPIPAAGDGSPPGTTDVHRVSSHTASRPPYGQRWSVR